ncbi:MAG: hypothetical protein V7K77_05050 [Nostoc sp.]
MLDFGLPRLRSAQVAQSSDFGLKNPQSSILNPQSKIEAGRGLKQKQSKIQNLKSKIRRVKGIWLH